jgi:hypothetical protein
MGDRNFIGKARVVASSIYIHDIEWARLALHEVLTDNPDWYPAFHTLIEEITEGYDFFELFKFTDWQIVDHPCGGADGREHRQAELRENVTTLFDEDQELWEKLAPALEDGSWIEFLGDEGYFRWVVKENALFEECPHRIYPAYGLPDQKFATQALVTVYEVYFKKSVIALQTAYTDSVSQILVPKWFFDVVLGLQEHIPEAINRPQLHGLPLMLHNKSPLLVGVVLKDGSERWADRP